MRVESLVVLTYFERVATTVLMLPTHRYLNCCVLMCNGSGGGVRALRQKGSTRGCRHLPRHRPLMLQHSAGSNTHRPAPRPQWRRCQGQDRRCQL